ncbi:MAG: class I SAM-dependent methyltransferase [Bacteroidota bacterium]|nr:class I SAM-dependent methyltransferase [Bacteroidota bacterium]
MKYEPIKHSIDKFISKNIFLKKTFFILLDLYLLRTWHVHKELKKLRASFKDGIKVLDAGAGFGQYSYFILRKFKNAIVKGIDISQSHVEKANNFVKECDYKNAEFTQGDLTKFDSDKDFDLIISVDVMEHIEDDRKVFSNFYSALKKGGMLLVSTPSDKGGSDVHDHDHEEGEGSFIDEHVRDGYSFEDIEEKLSSAGFSNIEMKYTYGKPGQISWKLLMKYPITMLNKSKLLAVVLPFYLIIVYPFCLILNYLDTIIVHKTGTGLTVTAWK